MNNEIDFVLIWVDGSDPAWQARKAAFSGNSPESNQNMVRYRDWDQLRYWFRAVEAYAPWVRKVHFVTCGQVPAWMNTACPKLHLVNHEDYIAAEYLPTFSSHVIELNLHRIKGLAEQFVYFNDDMFLGRPVQPEDFFRNGLPCDCCIQNPIEADRGGVPLISLNDICVIADHFDFRTVRKEHRSKWINAKYGALNLRTKFLDPWHRFVGFYETHVPHAYLKETFTKVWNAEPELLNEVSSHRFRQPSDVNQWLMRYWQLCEGNFIPSKPSEDHFFVVDRDIRAILPAITEQKYRTFCINDSDRVSDITELKEQLREAFETVLPKKSSYEK